MTNTSTASINREQESIFKFNNQNRLSYQHIQLHGRSYKLTVISKINVIKGQCKKIKKAKPLRMLPEPLVAIQFATGHTEHSHWRRIGLLGKQSSEKRQQPAIATTAARDKQIKPALKNRIPKTSQENTHLASYRKRLSNDDPETISNLSKMNNAVR